MNPDLEKLKKSSIRSAYFTAIGVVFVLAALGFLAIQSNSLQESDQNLLEIIKLQQDSIELLKNQIAKNEEKQTVVIPVEPQYRVEKRQKVKEFYERNPHCSGGKNISWPVMAGEEWKIDPKSINVSVTTKSTKSQFVGVDSAKETGFRLVGHIINNGNCVKVLGSTISKDGRGALGVTVNYEEYREVRTN